MNIRRSKSYFHELEQAIHMRIYTKVPTKWILIDTETGQAYQGNDKGYWDKLYTKDKEPKTIPPEFPTE